MLGSFGTNRFMIGDTGLGIAKLAKFTVWSLGYITGAIVAVGNSELVISLFLFLTFGFVIFVWWIVDLFLTGKKLRKKNYEKILQIL